MQQNVSAKIWAGRDWVPLAQALVEKSCPVFGLDKKSISCLPCSACTAAMDRARKDRLLVVILAFLALGFLVRGEWER